MGIRARAQPQEVLQQLNAFLCEKSLPSQFVTLFLFVLNTEGIGHFISAGHTPSYLLRAAGKARDRTMEVLLSDAYMLGMFESATYQPRKFHLDRNDILFVCSDGLINTENALHETFGNERLLEILQRETSSPSGKACQGIEQNLLKELNGFVQAAPQPDDITFFLIEKTA